MDINPNKMIQITRIQLEIIERMQGGEQFPKDETKQTMRSLNSLVKKGLLKFNTNSMRYELTNIGKLKIVKQY